jgi:hypothetical protein
MIVFSWAVCCLALSAPLRAKCATRLGPDGKLLVLQNVSNADDFSHGLCPTDQLTIALCLTLEMRGTFLTEWLILGASNPEFCATNPPIYAPRIL